MKKKLLVGAALTALVATGLYANHSGYGNCGMKGGHHGKSMMKKHHMGQNGFIGMFKKLNLTAEQKKELFKIRKEAMTEKQTLDDAFTKTSFDKDKFISIMKQKRDNMIELRADMMEKAYKVLTPKQKEQLKVLMDLKKEKMQNFMDKRMNFDKNCNGRG